MSVEVKGPNRPDPQSVQRYIGEALRKLESEPGIFPQHERRMLLKFKRASEATQKILKEIQDLNNQITQAQARLRSMELQAETSQGSANAYVEELVAIHFDYDEVEPFVAPVLIKSEEADKADNANEVKEAQAVN